MDEIPHSVSLFIIVLTSVTTHQIIFLLCVSVSLIMNIAWDLIYETFHPADFHTTFQPTEVILNLIQSLTLAVVPSSLRSCVYFNTHGRVTWQVVDDDNWLAQTAATYLKGRGWKLSLSGQVVHRLSSAGRAVCVATLQWHSAFAKAARDTR